MRNAMLASFGLVAMWSLAAVSAEPPAVDAILGDYRFKSGAVITIARAGADVTSTSTGQMPQKIAPGADGRFNYASAPVSLAFGLDAKGKAKSVSLFYGDGSLEATRIDAATAKKIADGWEQKIKNQTHDPACMTTLKRMIEEARTGKPNYDKMMLVLQQATRQQLPMLQQRIQELGALKEAKFTSVMQNGAETFDVTFENGATQWMILCLPNGFISTAAFR